MSKLSIARQPILDTSLKTFAYELFFRTPGSRDAGLSPANADLATARVMMSACVDGGADDIVGGKLAFINATSSILNSGTVELLPRDGVVLELDVAPEELDDALRAAERLFVAGYRLALDNYQWSPRNERLLDLAKFVKINLRHGVTRMRQQMGILAERELEVIGTRIETQDERNACVDAGIDYVQGYFICRPLIASTRELPGPRLGLLRLLAEIWRSDVSLLDLERIVRQDVTLTYRLLRIANSSYFSRGSRIKSIRQAIALLGIDGARRWVSLLSMSKVEDKPFELLAIAMIRGKMCESLAREAYCVDRESFFLVGLLSVIDAMLDRSMESLLDLLQVSEPLFEGLVHRTGIMGAALRCVIAQEQGDWEHAVFDPLPRDVIQDAYLEAIRWTRSMGALT